MDSGNASSQSLRGGTVDFRSSISDQPVLRSWQVAGCLLLLSVASMALLDHRCSGYFRAHPLSSEAMNLFQAAEHFGTPYGALLILVTAWIILPQVRTRVVRTISAAIAAGLLANVVKLCISRTRPGKFDFDQSIWSSFTGVFQLGAGGSRHQGFPSAHTAFAIGFALMLGEMFPVARRWFLCVGALVAMQRIVACAHFPSDVLAGAAIGYVTARYYAGGTFVSRICEVVEARLFRDSTAGQLAVEAIAHGWSPSEREPRSDIACSHPK